MPKTTSTKKTRALRECKAILDKLDPWDATDIAGALDRHYGIKALGYTRSGRPGRAAS